ncbi:hypothetical protein ACFVDH_27630 [Streptomyces sp. NPDC057674]
MKAVPRIDRNAAPCVDRSAAPRIDRNAGTFAPYPVPRTPYPVAGSPA